MFGYINPDTPYLFIKDEKLYKALYCGLCKSIGAGCGQTARTAITYDMAFVSALVHNIRCEDVQIKKAHCCIHPFKRRYIASKDETTIMLGCINTALAYYKLCDDKADGDKKGIFRHAFKGGFRRAKKRHPQAVEIIRNQLEKQSALEKRNCSIIEEAAEPTAEMMQRLSDYMFADKATDNTRGLFYALGKWIYLIDALDDYDKDVKKNRYNPFYNSFKDLKKEDAVKNNGEELAFIFDSIFADMRKNLSGINFRYNKDLTDNIILRGIPMKTRAVLYGECANKKRTKKNEQKKS